MITRSFFLYRFEKYILNPHQYNQNLINELSEIMADWKIKFSATELKKSTIDHIRFCKKYHESDIKEFFSRLGLEVTRVNRKTGKYKTIVHFRPYCGTPE